MARIKPQGINQRPRSNSVTAQSSVAVATL